MENGKKFCEVFRHIAGINLSGLSCPPEYLNLFTEDKSLYIMLSSNVGGSSSDFMNVLCDTLIILNQGSEILSLSTSRGWANLYGCGNLEVNKGVEVKPTIDKYLGGSVEGSKGEKIQGIDFSGEGEEDEERDEPVTAEKIADDSESSSETGNLDVDEEPDDYTDDEDKLIDRAKELWKPSISGIINSVLLAYDSLYESGYGLGGRTGILTNAGIVTCQTNGDRVLVGSMGEQMLDIKVYNALVSVLGEKYTRYSSVNEEPTLSSVRTTGAKIFTDMHLKYMFGYFNFCKGRKYGLRAYLTEHHIDTGKSDRVVKYKDIKGWIRESVERCFYKAIVDAGATLNFKPEELASVAQKDESLVMQVCSEMANTLKNVFVVTQRQKTRSSNSLINEVVRISSSGSINADELSKSLSSAFNIGGSDLTKVEVKQLNQGVVEVNVIFNQDAYSQDMLFAYMVLDTIGEQGIKPSWSNVILGRDMEENFMTYNFKDSNNSAVALYGSKGSGKGVMTLNLISSALADDCILTYMDAKPDTSIPLVKSAWGNGFDVCAYNGKETPGASLEGSGPCPRGIDRFISKEYIPEGMFTDEAKMERFILITHYYRGLELVLDLCENRATIVTNGGHNDRWLVSIFDEVQQLAVTEDTLMTDIADIKSSREKAKEQVTDDKGKSKIQKINYFSDPIWKFIDEYEKWRASIKDRLATAIGSTFRKAEVTCIFIWQTTSYPNQYAASSMIASAIKQSAGSMIKIVGRGALETGGSTTFGTPNSVKEAGWYSAKFSGERGGYWAIGGNVNGKMKVFKPFNVYSNADDKELLVRNAEANGMTEEDLIGISLNEDGSVIPEIGFEAYSNRLLSLSGKTTAQQLGMGCVEVDSFIKRFGLAASVADYMYNFAGYTSIDRGSSVSGGASVGVQGVKYVSDNGQSVDDYSDFDTGYGKTDEILTRVMSEEPRRKVTGDEDYMEDFKGTYDEDEEIDFFGDDVQDNFSESAEGTYDGVELPQDLLDYISSLEAQIGMLTSKLAQQGGKYNAGTYEGTNEPIRDYVTEPIKESASIDLGKEIGSMNFDADDITCTGDLMTKVTEAVYSVFGDFSSYTSFRVIGGNLYVNNTRFDCKLDVRYASNIPFDIRIKANSGHVADLYNFNTIYAMVNLQAIECDSETFFGGYIAPQLGCDYDGGCIKVLFSTLKNLKVIKIGKKMYTADDYMQKLEGVGRNYNTIENITWGSNAFFAKNFKKSRDLASACLSLSKNPASSSNCQKFLSRHGIIRTGAKVVGTAAGAVGMAATGAGYLASGAVGLGSKAVNGIQNMRKQSTVKKQAKSFAEGLKDLWNN